MASCRHILMPWEHCVCSECHQNDPHAIWLVKLHAHCFYPQRHRSAAHVTVVIDQDQIMMEPIRPLPGNCFTFRGKFVHCCNFPDCRRGDKCRYGHSKLEVDTWNAKKRIISGEKPSINASLIHSILRVNALFTVLLTMHLSIQLCVIIIADVAGGGNNRIWVIHRRVVSLCATGVIFCYFPYCSYITLALPLTITESFQSGKLLYLKLHSLR